MARAIRIATGIGMTLFVAACATVLGFEDAEVAGDAPDADAATPEAGPDALAPDAAECGAPLGTSQNCGACGHSCLGQACDAGSCAPLVLDNAINGPIALAVGANAVYVASGPDLVMRYPKNGSSSDTMTHGASAGGGPQRIATIAGAVYWSAYYSGVYRCAPDGCPDAAGPDEISSANTPQAIAAGGGRVAFAERQTGHLMIVGDDGGGPKIDLTLSGVPAELFADPTFAYLTQRSPSQLVRIRLDDGGSTSTSLPGNPAGIVVSGGVAYVALRGGAMVAVPLDGGASTSFGAPTKSAFAVATDGKHLYWTDEGDADGGAFVRGTSCIRRCPLATCTSVASTPVICGLADANGIGVDEDAIYWIEFGEASAPTGSLMKLAKPP